MLCALLKLSMSVLFPRSKERSTDPVSVLTFHSEFWWFIKDHAYRSRCRMIWLLPHTLPPSRHTERLRKRDNLLTRERSQIMRQREKDWSSVNHSIISGRSNTVVSQSFDFPVQGANCCFPMISDLLVPGCRHLPHWILPQWYRRSSLPASQLLSGTVPHTVCNAENRRSKDSSMLNTVPLDNTQRILKVLMLWQRV